MNSRTNFLIPVFFITLFPLYWPCKTIAEGYLFVVSFFNKTEVWHKIVVHGGFMIYLYQLRGTQVLVPCSYLPADHQLTGSKCILAHCALLGSCSWLLLPREELVPLEPDQRQSTGLTRSRHGLISQLKVRLKHTHCVNSGCAMAQSEAGQEKECLISSWICPKAGGLKESERVKWSHVRTTRNDDVREGRERRGREQKIASSLLRKAVGKAKPSPLSKGLESELHAYLRLQRKQNFLQISEIINSLWRKMALFRHCILLNF